MFRLLKLLRYLREINLSSEETLALLRRLETDSCRPEDYEVLIRVVRAHTNLSADDLDAFGGLDWPSSACLKPSQGAGPTKVPQGRRRSSSRGIEPRGEAGSLPVARGPGEREANRDHGRGKAR